MSVKIIHLLSLLKRQSHEYMFFHCSLNTIDLVFTTDMLFPPSQCVLKLVYIMHFVFKKHITVTFLQLLVLLYMTNYAKICSFIVFLGHTFAVANFDSEFDETNSIEKDRLK